MTKAKIMPRNKGLNIFYHAGGIVLVFLGAVMFLWIFKVCATEALQAFPQSNLCLP